MKTLKYRIEKRGYFDGRIYAEKYIIMVKHENKWLPMGDQAGIRHFPSREEAEQTFAQPVSINHPRQNTEDNP